MTGTARSNDPGGQPGPVDAEVRLRPNRIYRDDVLVEAWERVKANRGAAGVDRVTLAVVEGCGVDRHR